MRRRRARRPALDVLRAVAALGVVFGHAGLLVDTAHVERSGPVEFVAENGWKGIYLFFAISGYLIARPFVRAAVGLDPPVAVRHYLRRRAVRILPAHWVALTAMVVLLAVDAGATPQDATAGRYLAHLLLIQNLIPGVSTTILPVTWTLGIEAIFYVTVPLLFRLMVWPGRPRVSDRRLFTWLALLWIAGGSVILVAQHVTEVPATPLGVVVDNVLAPAVGYLFFFVPGILVAALETRADRGLATLQLARSPALIGALLLAALIAWMLSGQLAPAQNTWAGAIPVVVLEALFGGLAVMAATSVPDSVRLPRLLTTLGETSYGMYLWHWIVINALFWASSSSGLPIGIWRSHALDWVVIAAATYPIAWLSWTRVERPAMRWARRRDALESGDDSRVATPAAARIA